MLLTKQCNPQSAFARLPSAQYKSKRTCVATLSKHKAQSTMTTATIPPTVCKKKNSIAAQPALTPSGTSIQRKGTTERANTLNAAAAAELWWSSWKLSLCKLCHRFSPPRCYSGRPTICDGDCVKMIDEPSSNERSRITMLLWREFAYKWNAFN